MLNVTRAGVGAGVGIWMWIWMVVDSDLDLLGYGMVWYGITKTVWSGLVWFGLVWSNFLESGEGYFSMRFRFLVFSLMYFVFFDVVSFSLIFSWFRFL